MHFLLSFCPYCVCVYGKPSVDIHRGLSCVTSNGLVSDEALTGHLGGLIDAQNLQHSGNNVG